MKKYYIYHIPNVKIGCTTQVQYRVHKQGYSEFEILETHDDIDVASKRELELQKQYGYPVDIAPYSTSVKNRPKWNDETRYKVWLDPIAKAKANSEENIKKRVKASLDWMKKDNYKTAIQNIKGVRKPHILPLDDRIFIVKHHHKQKNQNTPIPKGKFSSKQLAEKFNVKQGLIRSIIAKGIPETT